MSRLEATLRGGSTSRLEDTLRDRRDRGGKAFVPFFLGGYPDRDTFRALLLEAQARGADAVEVGLPDREPFADGPVIARAHATALRVGASVDSVLEDLAWTRAAGLAVPVVVMSYASAIRARGAGRFCRDVRGHGADALLAVGPDVVLLRATAERAGVDLVPLLDPRASTRHLEDTLCGARGFAYVVAGPDRTGGTLPSPRLTASAVRRVRRHTCLPVLLGFGISAPESAREIAATGDGVVVGTALVRAVGAARGREAVDRAGSSMAAFRAAVDTV